MRRIIAVGITLVACAAWPARTARAQASLPLALTVEDAVARGLAHAPQLAEARAREAAAGATAASRAALGHPVLTATSGYLRTNHVPEFGLPQGGGTTRIIFPDLPNNYRARAELDVPLYTAGRVSGLVAAAEADVRAAALDRRAAEGDIALDVARAYWTLVMARESVGVLERSLQRADASVADVRSRVDAGVLPPNDLLSAQAQRARQNVRLIQARNDAALAEADLGRAIGAVPGQALTLATPLAAASSGAAALTAQPVAALIETATSQRAERQALQARRSAFELAASTARLATRPQVAAVAAVEPARPNQRFVPRVDEWNTSWDLGVSVSWSLWDGGRARADHAAAAAQADAVQHRVEAFDDAVAFEVRQRRLEIESTRAAIGASDEAVAAASEAQRVVGERFAAGVATNTDVLDAEVARLEAELERARLLAALRLGEARLVRAVGGR